MYIFNNLSFKACYDFCYASEFTLDEDGYYAQCAWCGDGDEIILCDQCKYSFCTICIKHNYGSKMLEEIQSLDYWACFACDQSRIRGLQDKYKRILSRNRNLSKSGQQSISTTNEVEIYMNHNNADKNFCVNRFSSDDKSDSDSEILAKKMTISNENKSIANGNAIKEYGVVIKNFNRKSTDDNNTEECKATNLSSCSPTSDHLSVSSNIVFTRGKTDLKPIYGEKLNNSWTESESSMVMADSDGASSTESNRSMDVTNENEIHNLSADINTKAHSNEKCAEVDACLSTHYWKNMTNMHRIENNNALSCPHFQSIPPLPCFHEMIVGIEDVNVRNLKILYPSYEITTDYNCGIRQECDKDKTKFDSSDCDMGSVDDSQSESQESSFLNAMTDKLLRKQIGVSQKRRRKDHILETKLERDHRTPFKKRMKLELGPLNSDDDSYLSSGSSLSKDESSKCFSDNSDSWRSSEFDDGEICSKYSNENSSQDFSSVSAEYLSSVSDSDSSECDTENQINGKNLRVRRSIKAKDDTDAGSIENVSERIENNTIKDALKRALRYRPGDSEYLKHKAPGTKHTMTDGEENNNSKHTSSSSDSCHHEADRNSVRKVDSTFDNSFNITSTAVSTNRNVNGGSDHAVIVIDDTDGKNTQVANSLCIDETEPVTKSPLRSTGAKSSSPINSNFKKNLVGRKKIRRVLNSFELDPETRAALKEEKKRLGRLKNQATPSVIVDEDKFILDKDRFNKVVVIRPYISQHLKLHQIEGIKFMWTSCIESINRITESGSGCIIAHSMGLGKTLQVR